MVCIYNFPSIQNDFGMSLTGILGVDRRRIKYFVYNTKIEGAAGERGMMMTDENRNDAVTLIYPETYISSRTSWGKS